MNFSFAFNDKNFSDRVLCVEIVKDESLPSNYNRDTRPMEKSLKKAKGDDVHSDDSKCCSNVEVKTLHVNSAILAVNSPFFLKLFKNGMRESTENHVTLRINASEESALMDTIDYMYKNKLSATSAPDLFKVLMVADKFEVTCCIKHCLELLRKIPMSLESAFSYFELPSSVLIDEVGSSLKQAAEEFIVESFSEFSSSSEEDEELALQALSFPLSALELVLANGKMECMSEDDLYKWIIRWACVNYPDLKERREILTKRLARFIYFPFLSMSTLKEILVSPDFDTKEVTNIVLESLYMNSGYPYGKQCVRLSGDPPTATKHPRYYEWLAPAKIFEFHDHSPQPGCVVYLYLTKQVCESLLSNEEEYKLSETFSLGGVSFYLSVRDDDDSSHLALHVENDHGKTDHTLSVELAVMDQKSPKEFRSLHKCIVHSDDLVFGIPWTALMSDKTSYFIDDILHLRAEITMIEPTPELIPS